MGFFGTLFSVATNKWVKTDLYEEQSDCRREGHKVRIVDNVLRIYPNQELLAYLKKISYHPNGIDMEFSVNGKILPTTYKMEIKGNYLEEKGIQFTKLDFERVLRQYGVIQIGLNGVTAGLYNDKGFFDFK